MTQAAFGSTMTTPPGGKWFWEDGDHLVSTPSYQDAIDQVRAILVAKGDTRSPAEALAEHMCPRMPRGFCRGFSWHRSPTMRDFLDKASEYVGRNLAMANVIQARLDRCAACPACRRDTCITCHRADHAVYEMFDGRRPGLPADAKSGVCSCAGTLAMVIASVLYDTDEQVWEGAPTTCWRFT